MKAVCSRVFTVRFSGSEEQQTYLFRIMISRRWTVGLLGLLMLVGQVHAYEIYSTKKGVGNGSAEKIEALHSSWYYNWNIQRVAGVDPAIEYVPMKHNQWWRNESELANIGEFNYFLGFNEPERSDQGNIIVANAIKQWPNLEDAVALYGNPGAQMGSPATANPNISWIIDFMNQAASGGLQVDFMAMHKYPTPVSSGSIMNGAQWYHDTYGNDVWITEFNGADWTAPNDYTQEQTYGWMAEVLFRMESTSYIKRYAIFPWDGSSSASSASPVFEPGTSTLTPLGKLYAEYHSDDIYGPYQQIWYYLHNKGSRMRLYDDAGVPSTADIYTEGALVEFELVPADGANYYIVNQGSGEWLGSDGATTYWTASETGSSAQWSLSTSIYNWMYITHAESGNYLYGQNTGQIGLSSSAPDDTYKWTFVRSGTPYVVIGNNAPTFTIDPISKSNAAANAAFTDTIAGSAADADNDPLSYSVVSEPAWLEIAPDGTLSGTPGIADVGLNSWTVQVSDGNGGTDTSTLNITVDGLPGGPAMTTGYSAGSGLLSPSGETLIVDYAALGGSDTVAASGYSDAFTVLIDGTGLWKIGDTVEITGIALPIHASSLNGTLTFTVLQGAGGAGDTGAGGLAVLGTATAYYYNSGTTGNMYVNFDTPVSFVADANSTSIGINISNTALLKLKYDDTFQVTQYNRSTGNTVSHMKVSVAGNVTPVIDPFGIVSISMAGGNATLTWHSQAGATYNILSKSALDDPAWTTNKSGIISAGDETTSNSVPVLGAAEFYRIESP